MPWDVKSSQPEPPLIAPCTTCESSLVRKEQQYFSKLWSKLSMCVSHPLMEQAQRQGWAHKGQHWLNPCGYAEAPLQVMAACTLEVVMP
eukprot:4212212-Amphidinium_carterae.1